MNNIQMVTLILNMWLVGLFINPNRDTQMPMAGISFAYMANIIFLWLHS